MLVDVDVNKLFLDTLFLDTFRFLVPEPLPLFTVLRMYLVGYTISPNLKQYWLLKEGWEITEYQKGGG